MHGIFYILCLATDLIITEIWWCFLSKYWPWIILRLSEYLKDRSREPDSFNLLIVVIGVCKVGGKVWRGSGLNPSRVQGLLPGTAGSPPAAQQPLGVSDTCRHRKQPLMLWSSLVSNSCAHLDLQLLKQVGDELRVIEQSSTRDAA